MMQIPILSKAFSQYGIMEIKGKADNPEITKYFDALGFDGAALKDETSWCAAFVNWVAKECKLPHTLRLNARSWETMWDEATAPKMGDVVVLWRGQTPDECIGNTNLKKGHVGFFIREDGDTIWMLGGNQSNMVCISQYSKSKVLTYRTIS